MVVFVCYDGCYPNLCRGTLKLQIDGKLVEFRDILYSNGSVGFFGIYEEEYVTKGRWDILKNIGEYEKYKNEIVELVNENVELGCCGGCL